VAAAGRRLDTAQPWADATLPDGNRVHAVLPPVAVDGTCVSLRVLRPARHDLAGLAAAGSLADAAERWLRALLAARLTVVVTGATGSGKTTLLGALLTALPPHVLRLQSRPANVEGAGAVPLRDLVRQALRMRPDRIVLGEVRGAEVVDLLVAFNTGHEGGLSTLHANSPGEVPARLEALAALAGLPRDALHSLAAAAIHAVVHCTRGPDGRRVAEIAAVVPGERIVVTSALRVDAAGMSVGPGLEPLRRLVAARGVTPP
jgi:pilus assembly protein CpaF